MASLVDGFQCSYGADECKLFVWVYGISTFVGYLMQNPFYAINSSISNNSL